MYFPILKCLQTGAANYLCDLLDVRIPSRFTHSAQDTTRLVGPMTRLASAGKRMFSVAGPRLWNQLEAELRESKSVEGFETGLKTHLFRQSFEILRFLIFEYIIFFCIGILSGSLIRFLY